MVDFSIDLGNLLGATLLAVTNLIGLWMQWKSRNETREIRRRLKKEIKKRKRLKNQVRRLRDKVNRNR